MAVKPNVINMPNTVKQSGRRVRTQLGVLHSAECPLKRGYPMSLTEWTINTAVEASWHEFVGPGVVVQAVHSDYIAWHASVANWISWGTEQTGYAAYSRATWLSKDGRDQLERLAMQWAGDAKYFGWKRSDLRWLPTGTVRAIVAGTDTTSKGFCTHAQIDPASRTDPGPNYPYDLLLRRVRHHFTDGAVPAAGAVQPIKEEEDPMPNHKPIRYYDDRDIEPGDWRNVYIGDHAVTLIAGNDCDVFDATATLWIEGIQSELKLQFVMHDTETDEDQVFTGAVDVYKTGGGTGAQISVKGRINGGKNKRLRLQAYAYDEGVYVSTIRADVLHW